MIYTIFRMLQFKTILIASMSISGGYHCIQYDQMSTLITEYYYINDTG